MRVAIVGSRRRTDRESVEHLVDSLPEDTVIVSGGCRGVDTWAKEAAEARDLEVVEHLPQWPRPYRKMSYFEMVEVFYARNRRIVEDAEVVYAFVAPDRTGGTENTIKHAKELGVKVVIL